VSDEDRTLDWQGLLAETVEARIVLVAEDGEGPQAFAFVEGPELQALHVRPLRRGEGIGKQLLDEVVSRLRDREFERIVLWVLVDNVKARRFYEREGWACDEETKPALPPTDILEVRYSLRLG